MFSQGVNRTLSVSFPLSRTRLITLLLAFAAVFAGVARAQLSGTGEIAGTVQDPSGAVVANATVTAINVGTNVQTVRQTTKSGDYSITPLTPGQYEVTVSAAGFEGFRQQNISVNALETVSVNVKLTVGQASETVTVTSAPPLLDTTDAQLGATMDNNMYSNLPLLMGAYANNDQRRATDFEYLMPGVQANYTNGNPTSNSGIVNGSGPKGGVSDIYIDGVDMPAADGVGDPRFTWTAIGVDSIDQFQVQTAGYSAQYGGMGVQNYAVKSGSNSYHGSLYEYLRNTKLDAWSFQSKAPALNSQGQTVAGGIKPREIMNEFGIVLSGPIIKNKLFLFGNYGQYRNQNGAKYATMTIPTLAMLGLDANGNSTGYADYSGYAAANSSAHIYDPGTQIYNCQGTTASPCSRTQFSAVVNGVPKLDAIPASRISPASTYYNKYLLQYEPIANQSSYTGNLAYGTPTGLANWYSTGRIDYNQSSRNQISFIIAFGRQAATGLNSGSGLLPPFNTSQIYNPVTTVDVAKDVFTINSHLINQFSIGFGRYQSDSVTQNWQAKYSPKTAGILTAGMPAGQAVDGFPKITFSGTAANPTGVSGSAQWGGYAFNNKINNTYTTMDNMQWTFGRHNFTFGGQYSDLQFNYYSVVSASGPMGFAFSSNETAAFSSGKSLLSGTGSSVASYLLGAVDSSSVTANVPGLGTRWRDPSFWIEDDYKVTPNLTLNLGVRWDIFPSIQEAHNYFSWLNPNATNAITGNKGTLAFAGSGDTHLYCDCSSPAPTSYKNWAPRFGVSWAVNPKTVVRGSYDVAYARGDWTSGSQSGSPSTLGFTPSGSAPSGLSSAPAFYWDNTQCGAGTNAGVTCGWTGSVVNPAPPAGSSSLAEYGTANTTALGKASTTLTYFDPYYGAKTPQYLTWTFGMQREITRDMSITATYVGSQGHYLGGGPSNPYTTNHLTLNYAAMAGYNYSSTGTATQCTPATCGFGGTTTLLGTTSSSAALAEAVAAGFKVPNPYTSASYYASNSVYQYYLQYPQYSGVSDTTSFTGNTAYHALQMTIRQREAHGLDFMINYTYSKTIDDLGTFRTYDLAYSRLDRSLSATDQPQHLVVTAVYSSPFGKGALGGSNFMLRKLASDWKLSGVYQYYSGSPIAVTASGCGGSAILNQCMPNLVSGVKARIGSYGSGLTSDPNSATYYGNAQYLDGNAFSVNQAGTDPTKGGSTAVGSSAPVTNSKHTGSNVVGVINYVGNGTALYVPGNAPRIAADNIWSMSSYNLDISLKRTFPIYESFQLQLEADMSNVTNHVVWGSVNGSVTNSAFGTLGGVSSQPRDVQLAARLNW